MEKETRGAWGLDLTYVWVVGISVAVALLLGLTNGIAPSAIWVPYVLEGTLVPLLALGIGIRSGTPVMDLVRLCLKAAALGVCAVYLLATGGQLGTAVLIFLLVCCAVVLREARHRKEVWFAYINPVLVLLTLAASAAVALSLIWWDTPSNTLLGDVFPVVISLVTTYVVVIKLWGPAQGRSERWMLAQAVAVFGVAAIVFLAFRTDYLFTLDGGTWNHWSFYTGPADLVRQGGTLLWSVPSQYGFLSILSIAWLPVGSSWEAMFLLNGVSNVVLALVVFSIIRGQRRGVRDTVASLAITLVAVFLRPYPPGPDNRIAFWSGNVLPSVGAYRFLWCVLLLALVYRAGRDLAQHPASQRLLYAGCGVWLIGCLWSVESAVYSSIIWLSAFIWLARDRVWRLQSAKRWRQLGIWVLLPAGAAVLSIVGLELVYVIGAGHGLDFYAYFEYALTYQGGYGTNPLDPGGAVWVLLLTLGVLIAAGVEAARSRHSGSFVVAFAAAAAVWITSSYFVGRSHPANVWNLTPILCAAIFVVFHVWRSRGRAGRPIVGLVRLVAAPLLIVLVSGSFANQAALGALFGSGVHDDMTQVDALVPTAAEVDPALKSALDAAGVQPTDPILFTYQGTVMPAWTPVSNPNLWIRDSPPWLPADPTSEFLILTQDRRRVYMDRFVAEHHMSGWLVESSDPGSPTRWLVDYLSQHYQITQTFKSGGWTVSWYQYQRGPDQ